MCELFLFFIWEVEVINNLLLGNALKGKKGHTMAGTPNGGAKAAATNKSKYGSNFYAMIGAKGGLKGKTGGFASDKKGSDGLTGRERARIAGAAGGRVSRRTKTSK
jgi:hypothetical protein